MWWGVDILCKNEFEELLIKMSIIGGGEHELSLVNFSVSGLNRDAED